MGRVPRGPGGSHRPEIPHLKQRIPGALGAVFIGKDSRCDEWSAQTTFVVDRSMPSYNPASPGADCHRPIAPAASMAAVSIDMTKAVKMYVRRAALAGTYRRRH